MTETEKLIKSYYEAFNAKNYHGILNLLADDVVHDTNQGSRTVGKEQFEKFLGEMHEFYDEQLSSIVVMVHSEEKRVAAEFICSGVYKSTAQGLPPARGQKYKLPVGCFFEIENGQIARITNYYNMTTWLNQVR